MSGGAFGASPGEGLASSFERRRWHHSTARPGIAQDRSHVPARAVITGHKSLLRKQGERDAAPHAAVEGGAPAHKDDGVSTRSLDTTRRPALKPSISDRLHPITTLPLPPHRTSRPPSTPTAHPTHSRCQTPPSSTRPPPSPSTNRPHRTTRRPALTRSSTT